MIQIIKYRNYYLIFSGVLLVVGILFWVIFGLKLGIDFTGGTLLELEFKNTRPEVTQITEQLSSQKLESFSAQPEGDKTILIRSKAISNDKKVEVIDSLKSKFGDVEEKRFNSVGPTMGKELQKKSLYAVVLVTVAIVLYVAYAFRKVSDKISSWKLGVCTVVALFHDLLMVIGVFAVLSEFKGVEIDTLFITALLTTLGYSVNDTIVIFDRIRFNLVKSPSADFEESVNLSVNQTMTRSINTTVTTLLALLALLLFGGASLYYFILALMIGIFSGAYSSIFIASPLLVMWEKISKKK